MSPAPVSPQPSSLILNWVIGIALAVTLFFILTQAVPFVQLGWLEEFRKKSHYIKTMRIAVAAFVLFLGLLHWKFSAKLASTALFRWIHGFTTKQMQIGGVFLFGAYAVNFACQGWMRHDALQTRAFDLGIFAQAVWTTLHGQFLFSSLKDNICLLGDHFSPLLLLTVPFYALWQDPRMLLLIQAVAAAALIFPLLSLVQKKINDPWIGFLFVLMFVFYLPTRSALREDFHPEILIEPLILWAFLALEASQWKRFALFSILILTAKENMCGIVFILGFYATVFRGQKKMGIFWMIFSVGLFLLETKILIPRLSSGVYFYQQSFAHLSSFSGLWKHLVSYDTFEYVVLVFSPLLFLSFFNFPTLILTFPILFQNILSSNGVMRSLNFHYLAGFTAFLFISAVFSFSNLSSRFHWVNKNKRLLAGLLLAVALMRSGAAEYYFFRDIKKNEPVQASLIREKLRAIPSDLKVLTHNNLVAQVSNRMFVYQFDYNDNSSKAEQATRHQADYVVLYRKFWEGSRSFEESFADLKALDYYPEYEKDDFVMLRKRVG